MIKTIISSGIVSTVIGVHLVESKKTRETIRKYCPMIINKDKQKNRQKDKQK